VYVRVVVLAVLCAWTLPVASARAADPVVVKQSAETIGALNGNLVYERKVQGKFSCMRLVDGKVSRAHGVPAPGCPTGLSLDRRGRVIAPFVRYRRKHGAIVSARWFVYDVKSDRVRPVTGLPSGMCPLDDRVAIWGRRMAYQVSCATKKRNGLWLKDGKKTQRILATGRTVVGLALRGGTLAGLLNVFAQDSRVYQLAVDGERCVHAIAGSGGSLENEDLGGVWIANGNIVWSTGYYRGTAAGAAPSPYTAFLTSRVPSHCAAPGPNGRYEFGPETTYLTSFDLDGLRLYYAGHDGIRSHTFPARPSYAPPPNDNFENAQSLAVGGVSASGLTAYATTQPGEPLTKAKQTIWYTFTPTTSGTLRLEVNGGERNPAKVRFGAYSGTSLSTLTPVAGPSTGAGPTFPQFDAVAGKQYWIDIGTSDAQANFSPVSVHVGPPF
jgi:hypothetical protein